MVRQRFVLDGEVNIGQIENVFDIIIGEVVRVRLSSYLGYFDDESDDNVILFDGIIYLGFSIVNVFVSEIELKRIMFILREQIEVIIDVLFYVGFILESMIRFKEFGSQVDIVIYRI